MDFKNINKRDYELLLKFPAYVSLLAANTPEKPDKVEKLSAVEFAHVKTYSCDPELADFYRDVNKSFESTLNELDQTLPTGKVNREAAIKAQLAKIEKIASRLGVENADILHRSMKSFKDHVSKAHHNILMDFLFPLSIPGLTDR